MVNFCNCGCGKECKKIFLQGHHNKNKSQETIRKMKKSLKGRDAWNKGLKMPEEYKNKLKEAHMGKKLSDTHIQKIKLNNARYWLGKKRFDIGIKISEKLKGRNSSLKGISKSEEHKQKLRISCSGRNSHTFKDISLEQCKIFLLNTIKYDGEMRSNNFRKKIDKNIHAPCGLSKFKKVLKENNLTLDELAKDCNIIFKKREIIVPNIGIKEQQILDEYANKYQVSIERQYYVPITQHKGYYLDGYIKSQNIAIEVDESHHFDKSGQLKIEDQIRQSLIEQKLGCRFVRIKDLEIDKKQTKLELELEGRRW
jgi:very-short-patch-repair endonuclease